MVFLVYDFPLHVLGNSRTSEEAYSLRVCGFLISGLSLLIVSNRRLVSCYSLVIYKILRLIQSMTIFLSSKKNSHQLMCSCSTEMIATKPNGRQLSFQISEGRHNDQKSKEEDGISAHLTYF